MHSPYPFNAEAVKLPALLIKLYEYINGTS